MVNGASALDRTHLARQTFGDEALVREVLGLFLQQSGKLFPVIASDACAAARRDAAHGLKGAALGIGAFAVAERAQTAETLADASVEERTDAIRALVVAIEEAKAAIADLLAEPGDALSKNP